MVMLEKGISISSLQASRTGDLKPGAEKELNGGVSGAWEEESPQIYRAASALLEKVRYRT